MATRVLLVDDDPKIVSLLRRGLAFEGFDVVAAAEGVAALASAERQRPHVVLLDISMPGPDGFEVCRRLRLAHNAPIIMLTARDETSDKVRALNLGADDYVAKPFAFDELIARIRAVLRRQQAATRRSSTTTWSSKPVRARSGGPTRRSSSRLASTTCSCSSSVTPGRC